MRVNRWFRCALTLSAALASTTALAENKFRIGEGGVFSDGTMWNPPGVPVAGDDCFQDSQATGELLVNADVSIDKPATLTVTARGSPARATRSCVLRINCPEAQA